MLLLPATTETGITGIYQLKRLWAKNLFNKQGEPSEPSLDNALLDLLGVGLLPTFRFLYEQRPSFETFENWVESHHGGSISKELVEQCNALFIEPIHHKSDKEKNAIEDTLTPADLLFWEEHGYVIIRNAISPEDCQASRDAICDFLEVDETNPTTWYKNMQSLEGIMVTLYHHPALNKNRASPKIRKAFEQLWKHNNLIVTTDKTGFNPPETDNFKYKGIGLHWDVSLATPIPFGAQGILYLTDTKTNQGALTLVPGFQNKIEPWLNSLPEGCNPREQDLTKEAIPIAANAGDFIIWHHALPHSSSPNKAELPRIVQYMYWYDPTNEMQEKWI